MAKQIVLVDTSILIDYYRKTDKINSGATQSQLEFWNKIIKEITIIYFDETALNIAIEINASLKRKRKQVDIADLFIAATAVAHKLPFATLSTKSILNELTN